MKNYQHQPLRKPEGWTGQDAALVIQLERQLDDIYRKLGALKEKLGDTLTISQQTLTSTEQSRVRTNIGAAAAADLTSLSNKWAAKLTVSEFTASVSTTADSNVIGGNRGEITISNTLDSNYDSGVIATIPLQIVSTSATARLLPCSADSANKLRFLSPSALSDQNVKVRVIYVR